MTSFPKNIPLIGTILAMKLKLPIVGTISLLTLFLIGYIAWRYGNIRALDRIYKWTYKLPIPFLAKEVV